MRHAAAIPVVQQFVGMSEATSMHQDVFQLGQPRQMHLELGIPPAAGISQVLAAKAVFSPGQALGLGAFTHEVPHQR